MIAEYDALIKATEEEAETKSAETFTLQPTLPEAASQSDDVLVIGDNIKGVNYRLARCCNPIYGDAVFGFISSEGVIKIHRVDCPNASNIRQRYPYRMIATRWSGKVGQQFAATLKVEPRRCGHRHQHHFDNKQRKWVDPTQYIHRFPPDCLTVILSWEFPPLKR